MRSIPLGTAYAAWDRHRRVPDAHPRLVLFGEPRPRAHRLHRADRRWRGRPEVALAGFVPALTSMGHHEYSAGTPAALLHLGCGRHVFPATRAVQARDRRRQGRDPRRRRRCPRSCIVATLKDRAWRGTFSEVIVVAALSEQRGLKWRLYGENRGNTWRRAWPRPKRRSEGAGRLSPTKPSTSVRVVWTALGDIDAL